VAVTDASPLPVLDAGIVGVPSVLIGETVFWGDDRLEEAAEAAAA